MKNLLAIIYLISLISSFHSLPHFIYDGIESFHECLGDTDKISFTIYGSISEEIDPSKMLVSNYIIDDMGEFQCSLLKNEESGDYCSRCGERGRPDTAGGRQSAVRRCGHPLPYRARVETKRRVQSARRRAGDGS